MIHDKRYKTVGDMRVDKHNPAGSDRFNSDAELDRSTRDISGYVVFSEGAAGAVHMAAHRMMDTGHIVLGHQKLKEWLDGRTGSGSEWIHLQFHMAVFELELGEWHSAHDRFLDQILPAAASTEDALTDAPALLWRLSFTTPKTSLLPWQQLRRTALAHMQQPSDPFVRLHDLLALAGAGDAKSIEQWLNNRPTDSRSKSERLVEQMAVALLAYADHAYREAATRLRRLVPQLPLVGGSRAQNELFEQLEAAAWQQVNGHSLAPLYSEAA